MLSWLLRQLFPFTTVLYLGAAAAALYALGVDVVDVLDYLVDLLVDELT